jgi:hypothetical protein
MAQLMDRGPASVRPSLLALAPDLPVQPEGALDGGRRQEAAPRDMTVPRSVESEEETGERQFVVVHGPL